MNSIKYMWLSEWFFEGMCESMDTWNSGLYTDGWVGELTEGK